MDGDQFVYDPLIELQKIETFLGLPHLISRDNFIYNTTKGFYCIRQEDNSGRCLNKNKGRKHPDINDLVIRKLRKFYQPYNKYFYKIAGKKFAWPDWLMVFFSLIYIVYYYYCHHIIMIIIINIVIKLRMTMKINDKIQQFVCVYGCVHILLLLLLLLLLHFFFIFCFYGCELCFIRIILFYIKKNLPHPFLAYGCELCLVVVVINNKFSK